MIPRVDLEVNMSDFSGLPRLATYWMPSEDEITPDEGIGGFRNTWLLAGISRQEAQEIISEERRLISILDRLADDANMFEKLAKAIDQLDVDILPEGIEKSEPGRLLREHADSEISTLECLELGVSGLSHALSAIGCITAASCRGHIDPMAWSKNPIVIMATTRELASWVQPFVGPSGCGFDTDSSGRLLAIFAPSIKNTLNLANLIVENFETAPVSNPIEELLGEEYH